MKILKMAPLNLVHFFRLIMVARRAQEALCHPHARPWDDDDDDDDEKFGSYDEKMSKIDQLNVKRHGRRNTGRSAKTLRCLLVSVICPI